MRSLIPFAFVLSLAGAGAASASDTASCDASAYSEVKSLSDLPSEVRAAIRKDSLGLDDLADRGEDFAVGCIGGPHRRLALAAASEQRIFIAIEHGGIAYFVEEWVFEKDAKGWHGHHMRDEDKPPKSAAELIAALCK